MSVNGYIIRDWTATILNSDNQPTSLQGMVSDADLPEIEREYDTEKRIGLPGVVSFPMGWGEMESSITLRNISEGFLDAIATTVNGELSMQLTGVGENSETGAMVAYLATVRGSVLRTSLGSFKAQEVTEFKIELKVNYASRILGASSLIYDPRNFIWSVNGVNQLETRKSLLGL